MPATRSTVGCLILLVVLGVAALWGIAGLLVLVNLALLRVESAARWLLIVLVLTLVGLVGTWLLERIAASDEMAELGSDEETSA